MLNSQPHELTRSFVSDKSKQWNERRGFQSVHGLQFVIWPRSLDSDLVSVIVVRMVDLFLLKIPKRLFYLVSRSIVAMHYMLNCNALQQ